MSHIPSAVIAATYCNTVFHQLPAQSQGDRHKRKIPLSSQSDGHSEQAFLHTHLGLQREKHTVAVWRLNSDLRVNYKN